LDPIPRTALFLGLAGVIPFVWGAATALSPALSAWGAGWVGPLYLGTYVSLTYGIVILSFMSGVLWGFATKADGQEAAIGYGLSVIPALWAFFMVNGDAANAAINLMAGFAALLLLDWYFWKMGTAPDWWLRLRLILTGLVLISLALPIWG
jgi:heme/copper-type cytochrome/quinol oxidase subunit 4